MDVVGDWLKIIVVIPVDEYNGVMTVDTIAGWLKNVVVISQDEV